MEVTDAVPKETALFAAVCADVVDLRDAAVDLMAAVQSAANAADVVLRDVVQPVPRCVVAVVAVDAAKDQIVVHVVAVMGDVVEERVVLVPVASLVIVAGPVHAVIVADVVRGQIVVHAGAAMEDVAGVRAATASVVSLVIVEDVVDSVEDVVDLTGVVRSVGNVHGAALKVVVLNVWSVVAAVIVAVAVRKVVVVHAGAVMEDVAKDVVMTASAVTSKNVAQ